MAFDINTISTNPFPNNNNDNKNEMGSASNETDISNWKSPQEDKDGDNILDKYRLKYWPDTINKFTVSEMVLMCAFPHIFILGRAYSHSSGKIKQSQYKHLLYQFHVVQSKDCYLFAYSLDSKQQFDLVFGVNTYIQKNPQSLKVITSLMNSNKEKSNLRKAIMKPKSKLAKEVLQKYLPYFSFCGNDISY